MQNVPEVAAVPAELNTNLVCLVMLRAFTTSQPRRNKWSINTPTQISSLQLLLAAQQLGLKQHGRTPRPPKLSP